MIGKLRGILDSSGPDWLILDVNGVGYHVICSTRTLSHLPAFGSPLVLHTEMQVAQDFIRLIGFVDAGEREWFRLLQAVQGVGTRVALAVLSVLSTSELSTAIALQDKAMIGRANGVGKKLAERIVLELKDKVPAFAPADVGLPGAATGVAAGGVSPGRDALSALINLGYGASQAGQAVSAALAKSGDEATTEMLIRQALKELARP